MARDRSVKIIVADAAPVILWGFVESIKKIKEFNPNVIGVSSKTKLQEIIRSESIDLIIVNPTFGGIFHPDEIRKISINSEIKIFAIEIGKLSRSILSFYDDQIHVTDDFNDIQSKIIRIAKFESSPDDDKENLSAREKEIVTLVVKGLTNQEIADTLFLSVHTVMTHRRNIARKLQIHSATGLTIYAIVNKLVDLSEIKL